jgi:hypothetical protein
MDENTISVSKAKQMPNQCRSQGQKGAARGGLVYKRDVPCGHLTARNAPTYCSLYVLPPVLKSFHIFP